MRSRPDPHLVFSIARSVQAELADRVVEREGFHGGPACQLQFNAPTEVHFSRREYRQSFPERWEIVRRIILDREQLRRP